MARALRRACRDRGLPVTGHAALRTTPLALRRLGQGSPAACGECGGPQRRAPECLAARQTASHHAALTPRPPDGRLPPTRRLRQRYHELGRLRRQLTAARCDLSCQLPITPGGWRRKAREGRSASRREDPIHLGAATRQRGGAIRRAERREQWAEAWKPRSGPALAETERLSASERPSKVRNVEQAQEAGGLDQKVSGSDRQLTPLATVTSIPAGRKDA